jgi:hypothetical protein
MAKTSFTDDVILSSYRSSSRSSGNSVGSSSGGSSRRSACGGGAPLVRRHDGTISVRRDHKVAEAKSRDRRASIRDSLFKSLDGVDEEEDLPLPPRSSKGPSLGGFLDHVNDKVGGDSRTGCDRSVSSAPALGDENRRKAQQIKSKRWAKKMTVPTRRGGGGGEETGGSSGGSVGGDVVSAKALGINIAQQGYIEVQDGKMRLVFDVEG